MFADDLHYDVFISYARRDAGLGAAPLEDALKRWKPDLRIWRDVRDLDPSQDFTAEIEKGIEGSDRVIVCITPDVKREDSFVRREIQYAILSKKPIFLARFTDVVPPISVVNLTWIDFFPDWDAGFAKLTGWLSDATVKAAAPAPSADPYREYVQTLYADVIEDLRRSVFSTETISLRAVESAGDVAARPARRLTPKYIPYALRDDDPPTPAPVTGAPAEFDSLRDAYLSTGCDGRVLLLGEPGAGKTTSLLAFARDAAAARLDDPRQPLPVFARISGWNSNPPTPLTEWLATQHDGLQPDALASLIEHGDALLLLDGLDELGNRRPIDPDKPEKGDYDPRERFLAILPPSGRLILSSRVEDYRQIGQQARLNCAVRLQGLDDAQMQAYLSNAPDLWEIVSGDADLKEALRTPLLLALFRVGFESSPEEARKLKDLNEVDLNTHIWNVFIERRWKFEQARTPYALAYTSTELKERLSIAASNSISAVSRADYAYFTVTHMEGSDAEAVIELAQRLSLVQASRLNDGFTRLDVTPLNSYRFFHLRLRDMLILDGLRYGAAAVRRNAASALGELGDARAVEPLIAALTDAEASVRVGAAYALRLIGDKRAVDPLILRLHDPEPGVRVMIAAVLGEINHSRALDLLITLLRDPHASVRAVAASSLGQIRDSRVFLPLLYALEDPSGEVRRSAVKALSETGDLQAVEVLVVLLHDPDRYVRWQAADVLGVFADEQAINPLIAALYDEDRNVRVAAMRSLNRISGNKDENIQLNPDIIDRIKHYQRRHLFLQRLIGWLFTPFMRRP